MKTGMPARNFILDALAGQMEAQNYGLFFYDNTSPIPATPGDGVGSSVLLCKMTNNGQPGVGLSWEAASSAILSKTVAEVWKGAVIANGTVAFARLQPLTDTGAASSSIIRLQFTVGLTLATADIACNPVVWSTTDADKTIDASSLIMPESYNL
jgi:hypothetical protein